MGAALVVVVTALGGAEGVSDAAHGTVAGLLVAIAIMTALTGARTRVTWFKVCPVLLTTTAVLLVVASVL